MTTKAITIFTVIAMVYALFSGSLSFLFSLFSMWGFGMTTFPDLAESRILFPSLFFDKSGHAQHALVRHSIASGLIYAAFILLVIYAYRAIERFRTGKTK